MCLPGSRRGNWFLWHEASLSLLMLHGLSGQEEQKNLNRGHDAMALWIFFFHMESGTFSFLFSFFHHLLPSLPFSSLCYICQTLCLMLRRAVSPHLWTGVPRECEEGCSYADVQEEKDHIWVKEGFTEEGKPSRVLEDEEEFGRSTR